jgi:predicted CopG family antitoxin
MNISVPDELHKRLKKVKGRFNVSGVCQEALEREIEKQEILIKRSQMKTIERLRKEKKDYETETYNHWYGKGEVDGVRDAANKLSYKQLKRISKVVEELDEASTQISTDTFRQGNDDDKYVYHENIEVGLDRVIVKDRQGDKFEFDRDAWCDGWAHGVAEKFKEIKKVL